MCRPRERPRPGTGATGAFVAVLPHPVPTKRTPRGAVVTGLWCRLDPSARQRGEAVLDAARLDLRGTDVKEPRGQRFARGLDARHVVSLGGCLPRRLLLGAPGGCSVAIRLQVEHLARDVLMGVRAADEPAHATPRDALDRLAEVALASVLEHEARLAQPLMLPHLGHRSLGWREA